MSMVILEPGKPCGECGGSIDGPEEDGTLPMAVDVVYEDGPTVPTQYHGHCTPDDVIEQVIANARAGEI